MLLIPAQPGSLDWLTLEDGDDVEHEDVGNVETDCHKYKSPDLAAGKDTQVEAENRYLRQSD